jgi:hypothetical protein
MATLASEQQQNRIEPEGNSRRYNLLEHVLYHIQQRLVCKIKSWLSLHPLAHLTLVKELGTHNW